MYNSVEGLAGGLHLGTVLRWRAGVGADGPASRRIHDEARLRDVHGQRLDGEASRGQWTERGDGFGQRNKIGNFAPGLGVPGQRLVDGRERRGEEQRRRPTGPTGGRRLDGGETTTTAR